MTIALQLTKSSIERIQNPKRELWAIVIPIAVLAMGILSVMGVLPKYPSWEISTISVGTIYFAMASIATGLIVLTYLRAIKQKQALINFDKQAFKGAKGNDKIAVTFSAKVYKESVAYQSRIAEYGLLLPLALIVISSLGASKVLLMSNKVWTLFLSMGVVATAPLLYNLHQTYRLENRYNRRIKILEYRPLA